jgi:putative superfamily III holin-X
MAHESLRESALLRALSDLLADFSDLIQKEVRLARVEVTQTLTDRVMAGVWMAAAGVIGLIAVLFVLEGIVFAIASTGIAMHWSCFIVAAALIVAAAAAFLWGRSRASSDIAARTTRQFGETLRTAREQLR